MDQTRRLTIVVGLLLIMFGAFLLIVQLVPGLEMWLDPGYWWPLVVVAPGVLLLLLALLIRVPALAVPASIIMGVGGLLFWQNATGNWDSWAYAWALIPGFIGLGIILTGLLSAKFSQSLGAGLGMMVISAVLFTVFGSLFGALNVSGIYWSALLIALGVLMLVRALLRFGPGG